MIFFFLLQQVETAFIISVGSIADFFSLIFLAVVAYFFQVKARHIFLTTTTVTILIRFSMIKLQLFVYILLNFLNFYS